MSIERQTQMQEYENEDLTKYKGVINSDHAYIHRGIGFISSLFIGTLANTATESYSFISGNSKYLHIKNLKLIGIGATVKLDIIKGTTANPLTIDSAGSTASELTGPHNLNDNSTKTTTVTIKKTPTYTDNEDGEVWDFIKVLGTSTNQFKSVDDESYGENFELIIKPDTYYVFKFTNLSSSNSATDVLLKMFWYEEEKGVV